VVLDHVAELARRVEVAPPPLDPDLLGDRDLDVVDRIVVPVRVKRELAKRSASRFSTVSLPR